MELIWDSQITEALKKSIAYEQSKTDLTNLLNHKKEDLSLLIEVIDRERIALDYTIFADQYLLEHAEDLAEGLERNWREAIATNKVKLETLLAFRMLFLSAWSQVKR